MEIFEMPESKKLAEAYRVGYITFRELMEDLEWYRDSEICRGTKAPAVERKAGPIPESLETER